ncbi:MAG: type II toxin-antitoxin system VapC family toxin [Candidatus Xenobia bacterium]
MITAIDTNILLDLLKPDSPFQGRAVDLLQEATARGPLVISEIVYGELAAQFPREADLRMFLEETRIGLDRSEAASLALAGQRWREYRNRPHAIQCATCGKSATVACHECKRPIQVRQHLIADFLIGAHAVRQSARLLTRDRGFYRQYFPKLRVIA